MTLISRSLAPTFRTGLRPLARHWAALLGLALFLITGLAVLDDYGFHADELSLRQNVKANLSYLANGDLRAFLSAVYVDHDKFYGMTFEAALLLAERVFHVEDVRAIHLSRHLHGHLFFLVGGLAAYLLALRLFGNRLLALAAMLLFLLHPRLYGHSLYDNKDIPFLAMFVIALFLTHRAFRRDKISAFALLGAAVGILANLRIMGLMLLAAVPALRALDFAFAQGWAERKRVFLTTGAFALAGALTTYALMPYLWGDPVERSVEWWTTLSNHPHQVFLLFRGSLIHSARVPIEYLPVWFSITGPPFALLLGLIGAAAVIAGGVKTPQRALFNTRRRFALLLVGCFAAPVLAAMFLSGNIYGGWRPMYFLWAPFALLAALGLQWLLSAFGRRPLRAAIYGAATAGATVVVISIALIHPNEQEYFNVLVDRATPEHLLTQYEMNDWRMPTRQALEWLSNMPELLRSASARAISEPDGFQVRNAATLPNAAQARLSGGLGAFRLGGNEWPGFFGPALHRVEVYGNTLATITWKRDYRAVHKDALGRERLLDDVFDVHQMDGALALVKEPCAPSFLTKTGARLRATPVSVGDLPSRWRDRGFESRYYPMDWFGEFFDGKCAALIPLPDYPIAKFSIEWSPERLDEAEARKAMQRARDDGRLLARASNRAAYDVYLADGELAYLNESCDPLETERPFYLNVFPEQVGDLPEERRERGFERFHFEFHLTGAFVDKGCAAFFPLPDYPVVAVQTGQYTEDGGDLWHTEFWIDPGRRWAEAAAGASGEPLARGGFDIHLAEGALVYVKEPCESADADARFFLHVVPERAEDLPDDRREHGFDNLDFAFFPNGALFEGRCAARAGLPDYPVASVRTGQYVRGEGEIWSAEFAVGR